MGVAASRAVGATRSTALEVRTAFVVGKGGVGKTTVAILLARRFARRGTCGTAPRVLYVALGTADPARLPPPAALGPGVEAVAIEGAAALDEYLRRQLRARWVHRRIVTHELYRRFVAAAPGLKELMALGQVLDEERRRAGGRPRWDAIVVDAPATGHALGYLAMPRSAARTFGPGLVAREVRRMLAGLLDPARAKVVPVTLPEALPLAETDELVARVRELGLAVGGVIVNRVRGTSLSLRTLDRLDGAQVSAAAGRAIAVARLEVVWAERHARHLAAARQRWGTPVFALPEVALAEGTLGDRWDERRIAALEAALERSASGGEEDEMEPKERTNRTATATTTAGSAAGSAARARDRPEEAERASGAEQPSSEWRALEALSEAVMGPPGERAPARDVVHPLEWRGLDEALDVLPEGVLGALAEARARGRWGEGAWLDGPLDASLEGVVALGGPGVVAHANARGGAGPSGGAKAAASDALDASLEGAHDAPRAGRFGGVAPSPRRGAAGGASGGARSAGR